jgi:hypothetical protein
MSAGEIRRRFRLALAGYLILAAATVTGLWIDHDQTQGLKDTQKALQHDTAALAHAIANGQTYLCREIAAINGQLTENLRGPIRCVTQQQRYQQIIDRLESQ